jgi:hypothetical protein
VFGGVRAESRIREITMAKSVTGIIRGSTDQAVSKAFHISSAFLRISLGVGLLSAVADRLGFWCPPGTVLVSWGNFHNFLLYTAKLSPWCPVRYLPLLGAGTTIAEVGWGYSLYLDSGLESSAFSMGY